MRAIAEETLAMARVQGSFRRARRRHRAPEFHEAMFESASSRFPEVKQRFDPKGVLNPGKIVDPPDMDDRSLSGYPPDYRVTELTALDWSAYPAPAAVFRARSRCNNNGACRARGRRDVSVPSRTGARRMSRGPGEYTAIGDLRPIGPGALISDEMMDTPNLRVP
jgi:hypothetical protein